MPNPDRHLQIGDYGLIGDCHTAALVGRDGSIDWCCMPRFDSGSAFGRLLDPERGGCCSIAPTGGPWEGFQEYLDDTLVLVTTLRSSDGEARLLDCFVRDRDDSDRRQLLRVIDGVRGSVELDIRVAPRFDYGQVRPWIRRHGPRVHSTIGGNDALVVWCDEKLREDPDHELTGRARVGPGDRVRLCLRYSPPHLVDAEPPSDPDPDKLDRELEDTVQWWREWAQGLRLSSPDEAGARRSGIVLKALTYAPTGAIAAAPTTSLPEAPGGPRNFDYRYAWVRDSSFSARAFAELGAVTEADAFRAFIMRSAAGHAEDLQVVYGVGGERRLKGTVMDGLAGYRGSVPVRTGNDAAGQLQLDAYGELVNLTWRWHRRGHSPGDDDWRFLVSLIDLAAEGWRQRDCGIWEWPGDPDHFVHSKVLCWSALDRGIRLADECMRRAPTRRWKRARDELRKTIERRGYDRKRGVYVQAFDRPELDAALLLLPTVEYVDWGDERMLRTVDAIREDLDAGGGLLYRYRRDDGLPGQEGAFLSCSFWLVECLARGGRPQDAREVFDKAIARANHLGLFSEEVDPGTGQLLGNFPQGLTHLAHISAAVALAETQGAVTGRHLDAEQAV
ncbi:MAG: glycoside hydrolase family 15 protein [Solirubrobacterales bacterium]|nr:glycoside hydrolase family 15 protein [Solirubrobacterales bacterium]